MRGDLTMWANLNNSKVLLAILFPQELDVLAIYLHVLVTCLKGFIILFGASAVQCKILLVNHCPVISERT